MQDPARIVLKNGEAVLTVKVKRASTVSAGSRADSHPEAQNWDARLGFLLHDVARLRRSVFDELMKPAGLTRSQWWILAHLSRHDGMIQSDLANVLDIGKAALGGLVDKLETLSFVQRRPDDVDRRVKRVYLTARGTKKVVEMRSLSHDVSERMLDGLDAAVRQGLVDHLAAIKRNLLALKSER